jgi:hypothetical protein
VTRQSFSTVDWFIADLQGWREQQVQSSKEAPNAKFQNRDAARVLELGFWTLEFVLSFELEASGCSPGFRDERLIATSPARAEWARYGAGAGGGRDR